MTTKWMGRTILESSIQMVMNIARPWSLSSWGCRRWITNWRRCSLNQVNNFSIQIWNDNLFYQSTTLLRIFLKIYNNHIHWVSCHLEGHDHSISTFVSRLLFQHQQQYVLWVPWLLTETKYKLNTLFITNYWITTHLLGNGEFMITRIESFDCKFDICHFTSLAHSNEFSQRYLWRRNLLYI